MSEWISTTIEKLMDFCQSNTEMLMIGGAALIVLAIIISVIKSLVKKGPEEELDFDEKKYIEELLAAKQKGKQQVEPPKEAVAVERTEAKEEAAEEKAEVIEETAAEEELVQKCKEEKLLKPNVIFPDDMVRELQRLSSNNLQEVEIKIQSAELKFKYAGADGPDGGLREEVKVFGEGAAASKEEEVQTETEAVISAEDVEPKKESQPELDVEEIESLKSKANVKFGADNYNISRSGKVFTEEELEKQIRD